MIMSLWPHFFGPPCMCTCTATYFDFILCADTYRYLVQLEKHVSLICVIKFYLYRLACYILIGLPTSSRFSSTPTDTDGQRHATTKHCAIGARAVKTRLNTDSVIQSLNLG